MEGRVEVEGRVRLECEMFGRLTVGRLTEGRWILGCLDGVRLPRLCVLGRETLGLRLPL